MLTTMEIRRSKGLLADHGQEKLSQEMERLISRSLSGEAEPSIDSQALHHKRDVKMDSYTTNAVAPQLLQHNFQSFLFTLMTITH